MLLAKASRDEPELGDQEGEAEKDVTPKAEGEPVREQHECR